MKHDLPVNCLNMLLFELGDALRFQLSHKAREHRGTDRQELCSLVQLKEQGVYGKPSVLGFLGKGMRGKVDV